MYIILCTVHIILCILAHYFVHNMVGKLEKGDTLERCTKWFIVPTCWLDN